MTIDPSINVRTPVQTVEFEILHEDKDTYPNGLHVLGDRLWYVDQLKANLVQMTLPDFAIVDSFRISRCKGPSGVAVTGRYAWISSTLNRKILLVDIHSKETVGTFTPPGSGTVEFRNHGRPTGSHGLEWLSSENQVSEDHGTLWAAMPPSQCVISMEISSVTDGKVNWSESSRTHSSGLRPHGIVLHDDDSLWVVDTQASVLNRIELGAGRVKQVVRIPHDLEVHGLAKWGENLVFCDVTRGIIGLLRF